VRCIANWVKESAPIKTPNAPMLWRLASDYPRIHPRTTPLRASRRSGHGYVRTLSPSRKSLLTLTMKYYVGRNAEQTAKALWEVHRQSSVGNSLGHSDKKSENLQTQDLL
jgi:hypothetical protein